MQPLRDASVVSFLRLMPLLQPATFILQDKWLALRKTAPKIEGCKYDRALQLRWHLRSSVASALRARSRRCPIDAIAALEPLTFHVGWERCARDVQFAAEVLFSRTCGTGAAQ